MRGYKHLTEDEFTSIKKLQDAGVPKRMATKIVNRSYKTVSMIFDSGDFDDYLENIRHKEVEPIVNTLEAEVVLRLDKIERFMHESVEEILEQLNNLNAR